MNQPTQVIPRSRTQSFHKAWLKVTSYVVWSFGPIFFLGTMMATSEPARFTLDLMSWPLDGATTFDQADTHFLSALTGGFLMGWGVLIWMLSGKAYDLAPESIRRAVVGGLLAWYILDCSGSIASGNASNVFFNTLILIAGVGPLWRSAQN